LDPILMHCHHVEWFAWGLLPTATKFPFESIISATTLIRFWVIDSEKVSECLLSFAVVNCRINLISQ
jgi:hypothetical protein